MPKTIATSTLLLLLALSAGVARAAPDDATDAPPAAAGDATADANADTAKPEECQVVVMNLQAKGLGADQEHVPALLADSMAAEIASSAGCRVITQADITQMLDFEATKAACSDASESCLAEIGGALGVDRVVGGSVGVLGTSFKLQVKLQNVKQGRIEKRVDRLIRGEPELLDVAARNAARELFDLPPLDEGSAAAVTTKDASSTTGDASTTASDEGGGAGTMVLVAGGAVAGVGLAAAALGLGLVGFVEYAALDPGFRKSVFGGDGYDVGAAEDTLFLTEIAGVIVVAVGAVILVVGGATAGAGMMME